MLHKIIDASIHLHGYLQEQLTQPVIHIISLLFNGPAFRLNSKRSMAFLDIRDHSTFLCQCARPSAALWVLEVWADMHAPADCPMER